MKTTKEDVLIEMKKVFNSLVEVHGLCDGEPMTICDIEEIFYKHNYKVNEEED